MKFITELNPKVEPACVTLEQDNDDVNILVNGVMVAWFSSATDLLKMAMIDSVDEKQVGGLQVVDGYVKVKNA